MSLAKFIKEHSEEWVEVSSKFLPENYNIVDDFKDFKDFKTDMLFSIYYYLTHNKTFYLIYSKELNTVICSLRKPYVYIEYKNNYISKIGSIL